MTVNQAVGLCPSIKLCEPDPVQYDEQFSKLLLALSDVSPVIEPAELGRVFVGVDGLEKLYGLVQHQVEAIRRAVWRYGGMAVEDRLTSYRPSTLPPFGPGWQGAARIGWGNGKFAAWVAATKSKPGEAKIVADAERTDFLAAQPIAVLPIDPDTHRRLRQLDITRLGDLARLPQVAVVSQFGEEGRRLWSLARGTTIDPVIGREMPEPIVADIDFPTPATDRPTLHNTLQLLVERALRHPKRSGWRVLQVRARARQENGASWITSITLKNPSAEPDRITAPLTTRIDQVPLSGAVASLAVEFVHFVRGTDELQLFARDAASSARAGRQKALRRAVHEIKAKFNTSLYHVIAVHPHSRIPERRYALIDYEP
jgi:DNA polymerase-4